MYERINRGAHEYQLEVHSGFDPQRGQRAGVLSLAEAARFIRTLQSASEREVLRRLSFGLLSRGHGAEDERQQIIRMLERGRLTIRMLQRQAFAGKRREVDSEDDGGGDEREPVDTYTVAIELLDAEDNPVPFEPFRIRLPDGSIRTGSLDQYGRARITGIREPGTCQVCFNERDKSNWSPTKTEAPPVPLHKPEPVSNPPEVEPDVEEEEEEEEELVEDTPADEDCVQGKCTKDEHKEPQIDWHFIHELEGSVLQANVPDAANSMSGATVGSGFDLGARNVSDLRGLGLSETLIERFTPYLGKQGMVAKNFLDANPLTITAAEAEQINEAAKKQATSSLISAYNNASTMKFGCLDPKWQTVIASVTFQYGSLAGRTPNFWKQVTTQDWAGATSNLRNFGDSYTTRRNKEANYVSGQ